MIRQLESHRSRLLLALAFLAMVVGGTVNLALDAPLSWLSPHAIFEITTIVFSFGLAVYLLRGWREASRALLRTRRELDEKEAERDAWRRSARAVLEGLSEAIDRQFRRWELTPAEREVALLLIKGHSHKKIADLTDRSERTARQHAGAVYRKAGLSGRAELAAFFLEDLMLPEEGSEVAAAAVRAAGMRTAARARRSLPLAGLAVLTLSALACGGAEPGASASEGRAPAAGESGAPPPDSVVVRDPGLYPEGIEYDAGSGRFLVSSVTRGSVTSVADDGSHRVLVADTAAPSAVGIQVAGGRLYVARADAAAAFDSTVEGRARLGVYDLASGRPLYSAELGPLAPGGRHFANDIAVDDEGDAYITDSLSPVVYRVAADGTASVFVRDTLLGGGFGLNGIELDRHGGLLVAVDSRRSLYRIPLDDPGRIERVRIDEALRVDGMVLRPDGRLVAVATTFPDGAGPRTELVELESRDGWGTARVTARAPLDTGAGPTTVALRDGAAYVLLSHLGQLGDAEPAAVFELVRVSLDGGA